MADEQKLTSGEAYTFTLLEKWNTILQYSERFEMNYLSGRCDAATINEYVGMLTTFYDALAPKVHSNAGSSKWAKLAPEFDSWKDWVDNPSWFQHSGSMDVIKQFKRMIGDVVELLDVTYFPGARHES